MNKKIIYVDMDDTLCDYRSAYNKIKAEGGENTSHPQGTPGFFEHLEPIIGGVEAVRKLLQDERFEVYILTAPTVRNPLCYTEKRLWVEKYFGLYFTQNLIISRNKGLLKGDFLIDDHIDGRGQEDFDGEIVHFASDAFPDWDAVLAYFR